MPDATARRCPACGNQQMTLIRRGYTGKTNTPDQYAVCQHCGQITYEIIAASQRDIRLNRYEANGLLERDGVIYRIRRILRAGFNEYLLYLRPERKEAPFKEAPSDEPAAEPVPPPEEAPAAEDEASEG